MELKDILLKDVECKHRIPIPGYQGGARYVFIFMDRKADTYYWVTNSPGPFLDGDICSIKAKIDTSNNRLSYVRPTYDEPESEQPDKIDAEDILLGLAHY